MPKPPMQKIEPRHLADGPPARRRRLGGSPPPVQRSQPRRREDSSLGCHELAAAALGESASMDTVNGRLRMEASSASWSARAHFLERVEASQDANRTAADAQAARAIETGDPS